MYQRLLVPLDGSDVAESVLPFAEQIAGPLDAELVPVRVVEPLNRAAVMVSIDGDDPLFHEQLKARAG